MSMNTITLDTLRELQARVEETKANLRLTRMEEKEKCLARILEIDAELKELGLEQIPTPVVQTPPVVQAATSFTPKPATPVVHAGTPINTATGKPWTQLDITEELCRRYPDGLTKQEVFMKAKNEFGYVFEAKSDETAMSSMYAQAMLPLQKTSPPTLVYADLKGEGTKKLYHKDHFAKAAANVANSF